jgi:hypothetical protein
VSSKHNAHEGTNLRIHGSCVPGPAVAALPLVTGPPPGNMGVVQAAPNPVAPVPAMPAGQQLAQPPIAPAVPGGQQIAQQPVAPINAPTDSDSDDSDYEFVGSDDDNDDKADIFALPADNDSSSDDDDDPHNPPRRRSKRARRPNRHGYGGKGFANMPNYEKRKIKAGELNNVFLNSLDWLDVLVGLSTHQSADYDRFLAQAEWEFEYGHPLALSMKANALDNPNWYQAMNGTKSDGYWAAMESEMETLIVKNAWVVINREESMHVLPSVWAFKCKRFPDGLVRKLKALPDQWH